MNHNEEEIRWLICTRCNRIYPDCGMKYVGNGQWMCELCHDDMFTTWDEAFERNKEEEE